MPLGQKWSFRWRPMASIYFDQVSLPLSPSLLSASPISLQPDLPVVVESLLSSTVSPISRPLSSFIPFAALSIPFAGLCHLFSFRRDDASPVDSSIRVHYERLSHSPARISRDRCHAKTVCATPARLRYRFPMLAQRYALSRLTDSSSFVARTSPTFNANAFQKFLD